MLMVGGVLPPYLQRLILRKYNIISGALLFITSLVFLLVVIPNETAPGEEYGMPPAFLPNIIMILIGMLSVALLLVNLFGNKKEESDPAPITLKNWLHLIIFAVIIFSSLLLMTFIGFIASGALMIAAYMIYMGKRNIIPILLTSIATPIFIYYVLWYGFTILLP